MNKTLLLAPIETRTRMFARARIFCPSKNVLCEQEYPARASPSKTIRPDQTTMPPNQKFCPEPLSPPMGASECFSSPSGPGGLEGHGCSVFRHFVFRIIVCMFVSTYSAFVAEWCDSASCWLYWLLFCSLVLIHKWKGWIQFFSYLLAKLFLRMNIVRSMSVHCDNVQSIAF